MTVALIVLIWMLASVLVATLVCPILKSGKVADKLAEEYWGEPERFDKRI